MPEKVGLRVCFLLVMDNDYYQILTIVNVMIKEEDLGLSYIFLAQALFIECSHAMTTADNLLAVKRNLKP
ncbi:MAG: hypothetical protein RQ722_12715 [Desulfuromonadales bacterium]|nr:hypothetical protein [Desulfuromonadales bacterium]